MLPLVLTALIAPSAPSVPPPPPPVAVEVEAELSRVRGSLVQRFLESGRVVASTTSATSIVSVRGLRHSVLVEATCGSRRASYEVDRARDDVLRLEVVHRAQQALAEIEARPCAEASAERSRAALEFVGFEPTAVVYADASTPLLDAGFDIVGPEQAAHWRVCVWRHDDGFVSQRTQASECAAATPVATAAALPDAVGQQAQAQAQADSDALLESVLDDSQRPPPPPPAAPEPDLQAVPDAAPERSAASWFWIVGADAGPVFRAGNEVVDAGFAASVGAGRGLWGGLARVMLVPHLRADPRLSVLETFAGIGPSVGGMVSPRVGLRAAVLGGLLVHTAAWQDVAGPLRFNPQGSLPVTLDVRLRAGLGLHVTGELGVMNRVRSHRADGVVLWRRGAVRFGLSVGLHWRGPTRGRAR